MPFVQVEIIANDQGNRTTPSYVAFTDTERLIGDPAKNQVRKMSVFWICHVAALIALHLYHTSAMVSCFESKSSSIQVAINPTNTIFDAKRLIGRKFADATVQSDMRHWPFTVIDAATLPKLQVEYKNEEKTFTPEEISSMVLTKMKETAEVSYVCVLERL